MKTHASIVPNQQDISASQLFEQNYLKKARNSLFSLFSSIDLLDVNYYPIQTFISYWRIIQFIGPALAVPYPRFWEPDSPYSLALSIISVLFHIVPSQYRAESSVIIEYIYSAIIFASIIILSFATYSFVKTAAISNIIPPFIVGFIHGFLHIFQPIVLEFAGESIGRLISSKNNFSTPLEVSALAISLFFVVIYYLFLYNYGAMSFVFRPYSLMTILRLPQFLFSLLTAIITFLTALASQIDLVPRVILTFLCAFLYLTAILIVFMIGSFISVTYKNMIVSASITAFISLVVVAIYDIVGRNAVISELFVFIFLFIIFYFGSVFVFRKLVTKFISILDTNGDNAEHYNSYYIFTQCATVSIVLSHPASQNWAIFKNGTDKWSDKLDLWTIFAKFVAIYPDERKLLSFIIQSIQSKNFHTFSSKQIVSQATIIATQRESSLSPDLKVHLSKMTRQFQFVKRKIRHVWDLAIQSNIYEMDSSINNAYDSVTKARSNFKHLFGLYPNNRFVARAYSHFVLEIEGDNMQYKEWTDKMSILQRGILVNPDRTNLLGVYTFPILPITAQETIARSVTESEFLENITSTSFSTSSDIDDIANSAMNEQTSVIKDRINELTIPAIRCITVWTSFLYFVLILIPAIAILIYEDYFLHGLTDPLDYMYHLSFLRSAAFQLPMLANHYLFENIPWNSTNENFTGDFNDEVNPVNGSNLANLFEKPNFDGIHMPSYGGAQNTLEQLRYIAHLSSQSVERVSSYRTWIKNDTRIETIHDLVFENSIPYFYYAIDGSNTTSNISLQAAMMDINLQITNLIQGNQTIDESYVNRTYIVNPSANADSIVNNISYAMLLMNDYLAQNHENIENLMLFCMMFLCIIYVVTIVGILIFQIENLQSAKFEVFQCLTSLPKNDVSMVAEKLNIITKETEDEEEENLDDLNLNKQEENIIKVFSSASDMSSTKSTESATYIVLNLLLAAFTVGVIVLICQIFPSFTNDLRSNAPHLDYVLGSIAYLFGTMNSAEIIVASLNNYTIPAQNLEDASSRLFVHINDYFENYHIVSYGFSPITDNVSYTNYLDTPPLLSFITARREASPYFDCLNESQIPETFDDFYSCLSIEMQISIIDPFFNKLIRPYHDDKNVIINPHDPIIMSLYGITIKLYDRLYFPMFDEILDDMKDILNKTIPALRIPSIILLIVSFFIVIAIYVQAENSSQRIKFALSLLLQCPINVVMQTSKVMDILSGDFGSKAQDSHIRHKEFFDAIVQSIPDSVIVLNNGNYEIISMNRSTERIYGIKIDEMIGTNGKTFFTSSSFSPNSAEIFDEDTQFIHVRYSTNENDSYLRLSHIITKSHIVITSTDQTNIYSYNKLISDEKEKSDKLLASILPSNLSKRVQNGEENISFSVQSATILFLDIVEFTPWCAANTAQMIMSTLNIMFRELDARLARHSTMTKIKCIGDCYMCAGGIFVEVNQPAIHAKETVEFGLEAISALRYINKEYDLKLRIRVGINTGGPIVAGVIGTDKPTFEILGPAINMAQQMEHHGVPMKVHISRSVYQLIYGGPFNIKERGKIEIKNGTVATYLVIPKDES
ncbi:hypothetical protein M9Y10_023264 [Tritrichomonas musculus]|uniref:Adenylate and Guanylate cyclase catalytic domain containing protein n=1 Tax=Tritrichomonas musculus TaxID=1915356 RepID=A0ABR2KVN3_9EUKA